MSPLDAIAAFALFLYLPIPLFWLVFHPLVGFWRKRVPAAYWTAGLAAWGPVAVFLFFFRDRLLAGAQAPAWAIVSGLALLAGDVFVLYRVQRDLGTARLVGRAELAGGGELATGGIYARLRHPRYAGMMAGVAGVCLFAGTLLLWVVAAVWWLLVVLAVRLEERELHARFGAAYHKYREEVPAFLPFRFWPRGP